jgi:arylsulfatase A-like enzyme
MTERASPLFIFLTATIIAPLWIGIEVVNFAAYDPTFSLGQSIDSALHYLVWQWLIFLIYSLPIALLAYKVKINKQQGAWTVITLLSLLFLSSQLLRGVILTKAGATGFFQAIFITLIFCLLITLLAWLVSKFAKEPKTIAVLAAMLGWSLFYVPMMRRASASLLVFDISLADWLSYITLNELMVAVLVPLGVFTLIKLASGRGTTSTISLILVSLLTGAPQPSSAASLDEHPDILIILIDTMRGDHLGAIRDGESLTPNLDTLATSSLHFKNAVSSSNKTPQTMPSVFTSLSFDITSRILPEEVKTLPEILYDAGYETLGISTNPFVSSIYNYDQGFSILRDASQSPDFLITEMLRVFDRALDGSGYRAGLTGSELYYDPIHNIRAGSELLFNANQRPVLMYLQTMDAHGPYLPPPEYLSAEFNYSDFCSYFDVHTLDNQGVLNSAEMAPCIANLRQRYAGEIRFTDTEIGLLIDKLKADGRWDEMLVWIISDHGDAFGEHDAMGHGGTYFGQGVINVPMILKLPNSLNVSPRQINTPVSTYDVLPTTLSILGIAPADNMMGRDLSVMFNGDEVPAKVFSGSKIRKVVYDWPWKMVVEKDGTELTPLTLYNLQSDPAEANNLLGLHPEIEAALIKDIVGHIDQINELFLENGTPKEDAALQLKLRSLGYVD